MEFIKKYIYLIILIVVYSIVMLSVLDFGIPNLSHPFTYHMDEWHQLMAVRSLFKTGTSNVLGAANGPVFFFFLSGVFLGPFYILKIIDPFVIKSSVSQLLMQQRLFEVLRLTSVVFGIGSIVLVWEICKKYVKIPPLLPTLFFTITPVWIMLSNYFKYDIALMFFILLSLYILLWFAQNPTRKRFIIAAIPIGAALAIKISALPLVLSYLVAYALFTPKKTRSLRTILTGFVSIGLTFLLVGTPDIFFHFSEYAAFFYLNIVSGPSETSQYILSLPIWLYMPFHVYPLLFGSGLFFIFLIAFCYYVYFFTKKKNRDAYKPLFFLFLTMFFFMLSLVPLKIQATGNRALVLLPFIAVFSAHFLYGFFRHDKIGRIGITIITVLILSQVLFIYGWMQMKYEKNSRYEASVWMKNNLKKQIIGLENIPIYQQIPDLALLEFYTLQENSKARTYFIYEVIDEKTKTLPKTIVITNAQFDRNMMKKSPKKTLLSRLQKEGYREIKRFDPSGQLFKRFARFEDIPISGLLPLIPISIYQK